MKKLEMNPLTTFSMAGASGAGLYLLVRAAGVGNKPNLIFCIFWVAIMWSALLVHEEEL